MGKDSEAIESAKRAVRLDPKNPGEYIIGLATVSLPEGDLQETLRLLERAKIYGLQGRTEEARAAYQIWAKRRVKPLRNLEELMAHFTFTDLKKSDRIAEALVKAGAPGNSTDYCKVSRENLLKGSEIRNLLFGHKITGIDVFAGEQFWCEWDGNGGITYVRGEIRDKGKSWFEGDMLFSQLEKAYWGHFWNDTIFRNPGGTKEQMKQYFFVNHGRVITYFSRTD
jgi:tetratricopeptide (TPR) repeat protein